MADILETIIWSIIIFAPSGFICSILVKRFYIRNEKDFDLVSGGRVPDAAGGGGGWGPAISGGIIGAGSDTLNKELKGEKQTLAGAAGAFAGGAVSGINNLGNTGSAIAGAIAGASAEKIVEKAKQRGIIHLE